MLKRFALFGLVFGISLSSFGADGDTSWIWDLIWKTGFSESENAVPECDYYADDECFGEQDVSNIEDLKKDLDEVTALKDELSRLKFIRGLSEKATAVNTLAFSFTAIAFYNRLVRLRSGAARPYISLGMLGLMLFGQGAAGVEIFKIQWNNADKIKEIGEKFDLETIEEIEPALNQLEKEILEALAWQELTRQLIEEAS